MNAGVMLNRPNPERNSVPTVLVTMLEVNNLTCTHFLVVRSVSPLFREITSSSASRREFSPIYLAYITSNQVFSS